MICPDSISWIGEENCAGSRNPSVSMFRLSPIWGSPQQVASSPDESVAQPIGRAAATVVCGLGVEQVWAWRRRLYVVGDGDARADDPPRPRRVGYRTGKPPRRTSSPVWGRTDAGRKKAPAIEQELIRLTEGETGGHPITGRKWVRSSQRNLSRRLRGRICHRTVGRLLRKWGFSPRVNRKRFTGLPHPDRDRQFRYIQRQKKAFEHTGDPRISVDTKKKELIGNFKNGGRRWRRKADEVNAHDFPQDATCRAVPYAIYDEQHNEGHVRVGTSGDTSAFAVAAIRGWWKTRGRRRFPQAKRLLITADAGGSNSVVFGCGNANCSVGQTETGWKSPSATTLRGHRSGTPWNIACSTISVPIGLATLCVR